VCDLVVALDPATAATSGVERRLQLVQLDADVGQAVEVLQQPDRYRQVEGAGPCDALRLAAAGGGNTAPPDLGLL
jgi:hypothetical protein